MVKVQHRLADFLGYYNLKYDGGKAKPQSKPTFLLSWTKEKGQDF